MIQPIDKLFKIPDILKNKLLNMEVVNTNNDDSDNSESDNDSVDNIEDDNIDKLNKYGYNFDEDTLKISQKYIDERNKKELFVILFRYIVNNIDDESIEKLAEQRKGWFW